MSHFTIFGFYSPTVNKFPCHCKCIQYILVPCTCRLFGTHLLFFMVRGLVASFPLQPIMRSHHYGRKKLCILFSVILESKRTFSLNPISSSIRIHFGSSKSWLLQPAGKLISASLLLSCGKLHATSKESVQHALRPSVWDRTKTHMFYLGTHVSAARCCLLAWRNSGSNPCMAHREQRVLWNRGGPEATVIFAEGWTSVIKGKAPQSASCTDPVVN